MEYAIFIVIGLILGGTLIWLYRKYITEKSLITKDEYQELKEKYSLLETNKNTIENSLSQITYELTEIKKEKDKLQDRIIELSSDLSSANTTIKLNAEKISNIENEKKEIKEDISKKIEELTKSKERIIELVEKNKSLSDKLDTQKEEIEELGEKFNKEFENLANKIFEEKSEKFTKQNKDNLKDILKPLGDNIESFKKKVEETYDKESKQRFSLEEKIKDLVSSSHKLSKDAEHLTLALKGDSKTQGNWGEDLLERVLAAAGLKKDIHYQKQATLKDENSKDLRPDYIIKLPDERVLIIDSKVSLTAYNEYFNSADGKHRELQLKAHMTSINKHIKELSEKKYHDLSGSTPNYVIMFIPLDGAFYAALEKEQDFYLKALHKNIVVVTTSTLLATLRTISYMWKQEDQKRNVVEIAKESGALYDKFVGFIKDLEDVGKRLDSTKVKYDDAMNKLIKSTKKGDTIVGRIERIKVLGASTNKSLQQDLIDKIEEN